MDTVANSCKRKPTWSSEQQPGHLFIFFSSFPFFFLLLARDRVHFLCLHAKVFRAAINSVLVWFGRPAGLAKPLIILRAWNCNVPSQVVGINIGWPRFFGFHQMRGARVVWRLCRPSVCQALCFFHTGVRRKGNVISYGKHSRANGVMAARPPAFYRRSTTLGFAVECEDRTKESAHTTPASVDSNKRQWTCLGGVLFFDYLVLVFLAYYSYQIVK